MATSIQNPDPTQTSDSGGDAEHYTFSDEITYDSVDSFAEEDFGQEVTSYALDSQPLKRAKTSTLDHPQNLDLIFTLPDSILLHILSFLPTEHAVATGVLSKRWRNLWTSVPTLVFRLWSWRHGLDEFVEFVSKTLFLYGCAHVNKFHLSLEFDKRFQSRVFSWLHFVTRHKVEDLKLDFSKFYGDEDDMFHCMVNFYKLPQFIYKYELLKKLNLSFCEIKPKGSINWKLLKNLSISYTKLSGILVDKILTGSPVLESLELYKCSGLTFLNVKSASLKKLVINDNWDSGDLLEISGPNLLSLGIFGFLRKNTCRVRNVASLVDVALNFQQYGIDNDYGDFPHMLVDLDHLDNEDYQNMLSEIFENIQHVKKQTIGRWCIEVLSICEMKELPSPMSKRSQLVLNTCLYSGDLPGIVSLLFSSPDLERLVINLTSTLSKGFEIVPHSSWACNFDAEKYLNSKNTISNNLLSSLKYMEVAGFNAMSSQSNFVIALMEFLLRNARVLERMVICSSRPGDCRIVVQRLSNFPRSSPYAEVILKDTRHFYQ